MSQEVEPDVWGGTCQWVAENGVWVLQSSTCPPGSSCIAPTSSPSYNGEQVISGCSSSPPPPPELVDDEDDECDPE